MKLTVTHRDAGLSEDRLYRYWLTREWIVPGQGEPSPDHRAPLWVCLNPSTADARSDDATVRSIMRLSTAWGYRRMILCNVFPWRATDPRELAVAGERIRPFLNGAIIAEWRARADIVVAAWGESPYVTREDEHRIHRLAGGVLACPGTNKSGSPKHPLYLPTSTPLCAWGPSR
jgi:hypothetical protein